MATCSTFRSLPTKMLTSLVTTYDPPSLSGAITQTTGQEVYSRSGNLTSDNDISDLIAPLKSDNDI